MSFFNLTNRTFGPTIGEYYKISDRVDVASSSIAHCKFRNTSFFFGNEIICFHSYFSNDLAANAANEQTALCFKKNFVVHPLFSVHSFCRNI